VRVRFAGFGGQGIVLCGVVLGQAAMLDGRNAMQTQSYGSASRGGLTRSDVCVEEGEIHDLHIDRFDVLVTLSQPSYRAFRDRLVPGGSLFVESELVTLEEEDRAIARGIPATRLAEERLGRRIVANMLVLGFVNGATGLASRESMVRTIRQHVPPGTDELNVRAYDEGVRLAAESREAIA
jgi:2-oxoglutarate ferredoxin oxidoreductase subunit gamma